MLNVNKLNNMLADTIYQYLPKHILDPNDQLTDEQWWDFCAKFQEKFDRETIELGHEFMEEFKEVNNVY